ncbi:phage portal protein [Leptospira langatensis]|uniref:Phage portal protein n=1 Tax=Leptospira langatensis TaxID=2484983 RepID=A0A5R2ATI3_9LEPT|nr:phage portal protein [Leptospira langatensis]TGJ99862.1 phage portal protein [Leptospira langatensis]
MVSTGGRPRGKNYEKNLAKRERLASKNGAILDERVVKGELVNQRLLQMAKSFFGMVNSDQVAGRKNPTYTYNQVQNIADGVLLRPIGRIPTDTLRLAAYSTSLISAIHTNRVDELHKFAHISKKEGLWFRTEDEDSQIDDETAARMKACGKWFEKMGDLVENWSGRDHLFPVFEMMLRDTLTIDGLAFYLVRNAFGKLIEMRYLDPATIYPVDPRKGYKGDKSIAFVQIVDNNPVETFGPDEILWPHKNHLSDVNMRGFGFSPLEACMLDMSGVINTTRFNRSRFTRQPPAGFLSVQADLSPDSLDALEMQWEEMVSGQDDSHKVPILATSAGEVKWTPLNLSNDLIYEKFMQWMVSFVLMSHGMDQAELGLRLIGSQSLSEANQMDKSLHSMTRAKKSILSYFAHTFNTIREFREDFHGIVVFFPGQDPEDEKEKMAKEKDEVQYLKLVDEVRIKRDEPKLSEKMAELYGGSEEDYKFAGAMLLNPQFMQVYNQIIANSSQGNGAQDTFQADDPVPVEEQPQEVDSDLVFDL